ncbi:MAG: hypothetical protein HYV04_21130 [Deltaproteobacteria bacterium]|nr:hypothetical protein [Deltaproteobacteria bacterium]
MADPLDEVFADSPAFAAAVRRFRLRFIWSLISGLSAIVGLVPLAHWISSRMFNLLPAIPLWIWQWGFVVTAVVVMWVTMSVPSILMRRLFPPRQRRYLQVNLSTGIAEGELRVSGVRKPKVSPSEGRLMVDVTDRPDALQGYVYDSARRIFVPPAQANVPDSPQALI